MNKVTESVTCFKKILYKTLVEAELASAKLWADKKRDIVPYKCPTCPFWHITHGPWTQSKVNWLRHIQKELRKWKK